MERTFSSKQGGGMLVGKLRRRAAGGLLAVTLTFGGVVIAPPVLAQPAAVSVVDGAASVAVAPPGEVAPQSNRACRIIERLADRFSRFPFLASIFKALRATFGCISPG